MKKAFALSVVAAAQIVALPTRPASAVQRYVCDPQKSVLCDRLGNVFQMEEDSDQNRDSVAGGVELLEAPNTDVARAAGKIGSYAASFAGVDGTYLYLPRGGALGNDFTVALWVYPTSSSTEQIVLSTDEVTAHGPYLSLVPSGGNLKVKGVAYYGDGRGDVSVTSSSTMTLNAWHLVVWGLRNDPIIGTQQMYVQIDSGVIDTTSLTYWLLSSSNDLIVGQRKGASAGAGYTMPYSGRIDQLTFAGRYWDSVNVAEFYNAGSGKAYPFVPSNFDSLNAGLVAYWKFDEAVSGGSRYDSVNQNNLTDSGGAFGYVAGKVGNAAHKDNTPTNEYLSIAANGQVDYSGDFTVGGWWYSGNTTSQMAIVHKGAYGSSTEWAIGIGYPASATSKLGFGVGNCLIDTGVTLTANTWYLIVADYTASTKACRLRFNNGTVYSSTGTTHPVVNANGMGFGEHYSAGYWDEWFLYKRVLTSQQMTDLYNSGAGRTYPF
jgi:hypothetical protein